MGAGFQSRQRQRGTTLLLVMLMMAVFLVPLVGLAIDGTMLYIVQAKLSSAVDGAALGAGRLLGTNANTAEIAGEFFNVNFPAGYWGARNITPTITSVDQLGTSTVTISATADVPLFFMRVLGYDHSTVAAMAIATRRKTRVMLVLDRSGSMNATDPVSHLNVFTTLQTSAKNFVGMFTPGTDELGLVVFGGSAIVAYPTTRPYDTDPHSSGGPDTSFATSSTAGPVFTQINAMAAGSGTSMAEALTLAYIELQKGHYRDLANLGADNSLNSIVLFTDGVPSALAISPNDERNLPNSNVLKPYAATYSSTRSPCTYNPATGTSTRMNGWAGAPGSPPYSGTSQGLYLLSLYDTSHTLTWWLGNPTQDFYNSSSPSAAISNCHGLYGVFGDSRNNLSDLASIPPTDIYGNSTTNSFYNLGLAYNGTTYDVNQPNNAYHLGIACWNATDNVGRTIRTQTAMNPVAIYTIGYSGNGGTDEALLKRLANTQDGSSYDPTQQTGMYIHVASADQLTPAFAAVASALLRLAK
jgi:hypothetical protein